MVRAEEIRVQFLIPPQIVSLWLTTPFVKGITVPHRSVLIMDASKDHEAPRHYGNGGLSPPLAAVFLGPSLKFAYS